LSRHLTVEMQNKSQGRVPVVDSVSNVNCRPFNSPGFAHRIPLKQAKGNNVYLEDVGEVDDAMEEKKNCC
jgi:hypothetical protein